MMNNTTLVLPTLNEEKNINELLRIVNSLYPGIQIIIADDGSFDKTQEIALKYHNVFFLDRSGQKEKGITASILDAVRIVNTESLIVMDADLQHPPEKIKEIADSLKLHDIVIGARESVENGWPMHRKMISWGGDALARTRLVFKPFVCLDMMSGFFGINTALINNIITRYGDKYEKRGYKVLFETLKYAPEDIRLGHVSYNFGSRKGGESKIGLKHIFYHLKSIIK